MSETETAFALLPFASHPAVQGITGRLHRSREGLQVSFLLEGEIARLRIPEPRKSGPADGLWRHTCFEMFVAWSDAPGYLEFNFSPSGEWAIYGFARYRERVSLGGELIAVVAPTIETHVTANTLRLDVQVPVSCLAPDHADAKLVLGLAAVIENRDDTLPLSYWALRHPCAQPDFHHREAFVLELDEIRH